MTRLQFTSLVESNQIALRRYLVALCHGDKDVADDIAQETFIKAYLSTDTLNDISLFKSWVFRIATNIFLRSYSNRKENVALESVDFNLKASEKSDDTFRYQNLYAALDSLTPKEKSATLLYYMEGYTTKEIAEILKETDSNIRQLLSRARKNLKSRLENE